MGTVTCLPSEDGAASMTRTDFTQSQYTFTERHYSAEFSVGRRPTKHFNLPSRLRARTLPSGRTYYYYDNNGRYLPAPRDARPPPAQYYYGQYGRDPRFQAPPPRDPYGREYQTPQRIDPGYIWGNRRYY